MPESGTGHDDVGFGRDARARAARRSPGATRRRCGRRRMRVGPREVDVLEDAGRRDREGERGATRSRRAIDARSRRARRRARSARRSGRTRRSRRRRPASRRGMPSDERAGCPFGSRAAKIPRATGSRASRPRGPRGARRRSRRRASRACERAMRWRMTSESEVVVKSAPSASSRRADLAGVDEVAVVARAPSGPPARGEDDRLRVASAARRRRSSTARARWRCGPAGATRRASSKTSAT